MIRRRTALLLAAAFAMAAVVVPAEAYDYVTLSGRSVSATLVTNANGYTAITMNSCVAPPPLGATCTFTVTNKGTTTQYYNVSEDPNGGDVTEYRIDGSAWQTSGTIMAPNPVAVGASVTVEAKVTGALGTRHAYFSVLGEKADTLNSMQTRIDMTITAS